MSHEKNYHQGAFSRYRFEELGFERQIRPNQRAHYGVMDLSEGH